MANIQIKSNQESVNPQLGQHVAPHANVTVPYEAGQKVWGSIRHGLDWYNSAEEQRDALRAVQASNQALEEIGKLKIDYTENYQGSNAENLTQRFQADSARIMNDCYANAKIRYKKSETMYNRAVGNAIANGNVWAYKYETDQVNQAKMDNIGAMSGNLWAGYEGGMSLDVCMGQLRETIDDLFPNRPKEARDKIFNQQMDRWAAEGVRNYISQGNYGAAMAVLGQLDSHLSPAIRTQLNGMLYKAQMNDENSRIARYMADHGLLGDKGREYIRSLGITAGAKGKYTAQVSLEGLSKYAAAGLDGVTGFLNFNGINDIVVTSAVNDFGGHVENSAHYRGMAIDIDSEALAAMSPAERNAYARRLEQMFNGLHVLNEYDSPSANSTGGHFHLDFSDYKPSNATATTMREEYILRMADSYAAENLRRQKQEQAMYNRQFHQDVIGGKGYAKAVEAIMNSHKLNDEQKAERLEMITRLYTGNDGKPMTLFSTSGTGLDFVKYCISGDYLKDLELIEAYYNMPMTNREALSEKERNPYRNAMLRIDDFMSAVNPTWGNVATYREADQYKTMLNDIMTLTNNGVEQDELMKVVTKYAEENGWDVTAIMNAIQWELLGKGQYKRPTKLVG